MPQAPEIAALRVGPPTVLRDVAVPAGGAVALALPAGATGDAIEVSGVGVIMRQC